MTLREVNAFSFLWYAILLVVVTLGPWPLTIIMAATKLFILWVLPALNLTALFEYVSRRAFTVAEFLTVAALQMLLTLPFLLLLSYQWLDQLHSNLPLLQAVVIALPLLFINRSFGGSPRRLMTIMTSPLTWLVLGYIGLTVLLTHAFKSLPDIDPYKWANWYTIWLSGPHPQALPTRPLFYFLMYYASAAGLPTVTVFKYLYPFVPLLVWVPAWLVAQHYRRTWTRLILLLLPLMSPSTILYLQMPMPQSVLIILCFFMFYLIMYAALVPQKSFYYYLAGVLGAVAFFYHQAAAIIFLLWVVGTIFYHRQHVTSLLRRRPLFSVAGALLILFTFRASGINDFVLHWFGRLLPHLRIQPNWRFPAEYINIDGQAVGWAGGIGVLKYYLFYAGPAILFLLGGLVIALVSSKKYRLQYQKMFRRDVRNTLVILWLWFFCLAEVLPRVASIALLPDRAWIFVGIFSGVFLVSPLLTSGPRQRMIAGSLIGLSLVSVGGAVYINQLKAHTIPDYQVEAAEWIKRNLPSDRVMLSSEQPYLLTTHAESELWGIQPEDLCTTRLASESAQHDLLIRYQPANDRERGQIIETYLGNLNAFLKSHSEITNDDILAQSEHFIRMLNLNSRSLDEDEKPLKDRMYIYYAQPDEQNLLRDRPYVQAWEKSACVTPTLDQYPHLFSKIYDDQGRVMIWQIK